MSYQTYITDAVVVGSYASNTADKSYLLFTKRAGMLYATARSVREERSKQRYALQDFSHITVTLVKGKGGWRIGSVDTHTNYFMQASSRAARGSIVRLAKVLRRYVQGEAVDHALYQEFVESVAFLTNADVPERSAYESCAIVRLLVQLGYVAPNATLLPLCEGSLDSLLPADVAAADEIFIATYTAAQAVSHLEG
jgi:recombinational DNA repair protein (RecF pathway)